MSDRTYIAIDLKSFYASVECVDRKLDPLATNLVVADESRTKKTICVAVSPALKAYGIPGRARLFEVVQKVREANALRLLNAPSRRFWGKSSNAPELNANPSLEIGYLVARPRMARYMEVSSLIYGIYMRHVSPDDIHVYSIDEVFIDATQYLRMYNLTARAFTIRLIRDVLRETGITATAGIGTNLYLCKIAMDIVAKHIPPDRDGVRIAELDERSYRQQLWTHRPLTDFWRIGHGIAPRLEEHGLRTMGDVARMSLQNEEMLYRLFGVNAELVIDHAWGWEPCTIADIRSYQPDTHSISQGQVLQEPYDFGKGRLVAKEMADSLSLELVRKRLVTDQMELTVCYDVENLKGCGRGYDGPVVSDRYGRLAPKDAHGTERLGRHTSSSRLIMEAIMRIYDRTVARGLLVRRLYVVANHILPEAEAATASRPEQLDLFTDYAKLEKRRAEEQAQLDKERKAQEAVLAIREKLGKNAILKGMNLQDGATARERNQQIGGHKA
ncbi:MAG: DNA methylase [Oligosphaeraceae bacterium]